MKIIIPIACVFLQYLFLFSFFGMTFNTSLVVIFILPFFECLKQFLYFTVLGPILEEIIFRNGVLKISEYFLNKHVAAFLTAILFAGCHAIYGSMIQAIALLPLSIALSYIRLHYPEDLLPCIYTHSIYNMVGFCVGIWSALHG